MKSKSTQYTSLRFVTRFSCIGSACEDNCCHSWAVGIDQSKLSQIRKTLRRSPDELQRLNDGIELLPPNERTRESFARLRMRDDGRCFMLDGDGLCSIHRRHGQALLPEICRTFPRFASVSECGVELTATPACPEVARLMLLAPDATDIITIDAESAGHPPTPVQSYPNVPREAVEISTRIRRRMHELLGHTEYPLDSCLYFVLEFANHLRQLPPGQDEIGWLIEALDRPDSLQGLHERFVELRRLIEVDLGPAAIAATWCCSKKNSDPFARVCLDILRTYATADDTAGGEVKIEIKVSEYKRRREIVLGVLGHRVGLYLRNRARYLCFENWHLRERDFSQTIRSVFLQLVLLRFLLVSHPDALAAAQDPVNGADRMDRLAVRLFYMFSRMLDANRNWTTEFFKLVTEQVPDFDAAVRLLAI